MDCAQPYGSWTVHNLGPFHGPGPIHPILEAYHPASKLPFQN